MAPKRKVRVQQEILEEEFNSESFEKDLNAIKNKICIIEKDFETLISKSESHLQNIKDWEITHHSLLKKIESSFNSSNTRIKLDVGGKLFSVSKETLMSIENTYFYGLLANSDKFKTNEEGVFFIDRNPLVFDRILDYYRTKKLDTLDLTPYMINMLKDDMDYYCIPFPEELQNAHVPISIPTPTLMWDESRKPNHCTLSNNNLTLKKTSGNNGGYNCGVIGNIAVNRFTVRVSVPGCIMIGFTTGVDWDPNGNNKTKGWFIFVGNGSLYGIGITETTGIGHNYSFLPMNNRDYITIIREGTTIRIEKNKINLRTCPGFINIPNQPLFPVVEMGNKVSNSDVTIVHDY